MHVWVNLVLTELLSFRFPSKLRHSIYGFFHKGIVKTRHYLLPMRFCWNFSPLLPLKRGPGQVEGVQQAIKICLPLLWYIHGKGTFTWGLWLKCIHNCFLIIRKPFPYYHLSAGWIMENLWEKKKRKWDGIAKIRCVIFLRNQKTVTVPSNCKDTPQHDNKAFMTWWFLWQKFLQLDYPDIVLWSFSKITFFCQIICTSSQSLSHAIMFSFQFKIWEISFFAFTNILLNSSKFMEHALNTVYLFH